MSREKATLSLSPILHLDSFGYDVFESPIGDLAVVLGNRGIVCLDVVDDALHTRFRTRFSVEIHRMTFPPDWYSAIVSVLGGSAPSPLRFDLAGLTSFQQAVLDSVSEIPVGETRSYGWVAAKTGHPGAARAVGTALARNPVPVLIPCHRVIPADGAIGHYSLGGSRNKETLLIHEKAACFSTEDSK